VIPPRAPGATRIILVRHGRAALEPGRICGRLDPPLSAAGRSEVALVARWLSKVGFGSVYSSPARRAQETARLIVAQRGLAICMLPELREVDFGAFEGLTWDEALGFDPGTCATWISRPQQVVFPGGESLADVQARVRMALNTVRERHAEQSVLVVAHAGPNRTILGDALGLPAQAVFALPQHTAAVNVLDWVGPRLVTRMVNRTPVMARRAGALAAAVTLALAARAAAEETQAAMAGEKSLADEAKDELLAPVPSVELALANAATAIGAEPHVNMPCCEAGAEPRIPSGRRNHADRPDGREQREECVEGRRARPVQPKRTGRRTVAAEGSPARSLIEGPRRARRLLSNHEPNPSPHRPLAGAYVRRVLQRLCVTVALAASLIVPVRAEESLAVQGVDGGGPAWIGPRPTRPAHRVITLAPNLTDVLVAMGLGDRIVGVTSVDRAPEVASLPRVGSYVDPNPEAILGLRPDLVLWAYNAGALPTVRRLAEMLRGSSQPFPILVLPAETVADALATPGAVGEAMGEAAAGRALQASMTAAVERFRERARRMPRRRVLFVVGRQPLVVAGPGSFPDELLNMAGCDNVVTQGPYWSFYSLERAVADAPDLVIDASLHEPEATAAKLEVIPAVHRGSRFALRSDDLLHPGPKMVQGLDELLRALAIPKP